MMDKKVKMRLTSVRIVTGSTAVLGIGLTLLLGCYSSSAFRLSDDDAQTQHHPHRQNSLTISSNSYDNSRNFELNKSDKAKGSSRALPLKSSVSSSSSSSSSSFKSEAARASKGGASSSNSGSRSLQDVISKRSLSLSSSSDPTSFRSHLHENSILNVAWPVNTMWGFLPSKNRKPEAERGDVILKSSQNAQSPKSSFTKKAISSSSSLSQSLPEKQKSVSSDLFLDPVMLDEIPSPYFGNRRSDASSSRGETRNSDINNHGQEGMGGGASAAAAAGETSSPSNSFFHNSVSSAIVSSSSSSGSAPSSSHGGERRSPTPPPRPHYILLQPPTRIEPPLGNDEPDNDESFDNEVDSTRELPSSSESAEHHNREDEGEAEHSTWLKRSLSGVPSRTSPLDIHKRTRQYDIPQIECSPADDGMERFACPSTDHLGRYRCVDDHVLCDGYIDCPGREDEDLQACMFYKTTKAHLDVLADALLRWARGKR